MTRCQAPLAFEVLVDYWASELDEPTLDRVETHLFGCSECTEASARLAALTETLRRLEPPFLTAERLAALRTNPDLVIEDNLVLPDVRGRVVFDHQDFIIHRLGGLDLRQAAEVTVTVQAEESGETILRGASVPFDRERGEVLVACRRHFAAFPPNIVFLVTARDAGGSEMAARYVVEHAFRTGADPR